MVLNKQIKLALWFVWMTTVISQPVFALEKQMVMGAGPSTAVTALFFEHFSKTDAAKGYQFEVVPRSIKHAGGIKASNKYVFGRTGRPLNEKEKALNKRDLFIARIPLSIVVGRSADVDALSLKQLEKIFTGKITNWKEVGGADHEIIVVGREKTEAAFGVLKKHYPFFKGSNFTKVFTRDHQVVNFMKSKQGQYAISFGARSNFEDQYHLQVKNFEVGVSLGLVYDLSNAQHPLVKSAQAFALSATWNKIVSNSDFLPPKAN